MPDQYKNRKGFTDRGRQSEWGAAGDAKSQPLQCLRQCKNGYEGRTSPHDLFVNKISYIS